MIFCFNEMCMNFKSAKTLDYPSWEKVLSCFLRILRQAKQRDGKTPELRSETGLMKRLLGEYEQFNTMINAKEHNDIRTLFLSICDKNPYMEEEKEVFLVHGQSVKGLSAAYHLDVPAISFDFPNIDRNPIVTVTSKVDASEKEVFNFIHEGQFECYDKFYRSANHCQSYIASLDDLKSKVKENKYWERLKFPDDFIKLKINKRYIKGVVNKLCILNEFLFSNFASRLSFDDLCNVLPDVRDESGSVRNDKNKMKSRTKIFGEKEVECLTHTSLDGSYRLYFKVEYQKRQIYIGYIGKHLDTGRYKGN